MIWLVKRGKSRRPRSIQEKESSALDGIISYEREREQAGAVDSSTSWFGHVPVHDIIPAGEEQLLKHCWAYVHAQSSASLSPEMYAEFIQPYNAEIAALVGYTYYHGCEDLSKKCAVIKDLPGLRLFHVSPWTPARPIAECFGTGCVLEVHSHPTGVLYTYTDAEIREELQTRSDEVGDAPHTSALADVEEVSGKTDKLIRWAELAQDAAHRNRSRRYSTSIILRYEFLRYPLPPHKPRNCIKHPL